MSEKLSPKSMKAAERQERERAELAHEVKDFVNVDSYDRAHVPSGSGRASGNFLSDHELRMIYAHRDQIEGGLEAPSVVEKNSSNPELEQLRAENAELRAELAEMRKAIAELTATLRGGAVVQAEQGFDVNAEADAAKVRLSQEAETKAQAAIDAIHSTDQAKADKALLDDGMADVEMPLKQRWEQILAEEPAGGKESEAIPNSELKLDEHGQAELNRILTEEDQTHGSRTAQVGDTFHAPAVEQSDSVPSSVVERMAAVRAATGNTENDTSPAPDSIAARMDVIANASVGTNEPASSSQDSSRRRWRDRLTPTGLAAEASAWAATRRERDNGSDQSRRKKLLAGFVLFGGAIGGGLLLMKGHDIFGHRGGNGFLGDILKDIPTDGGRDPQGGGKGSGGGGGGADILKTVRVNPGDGEIKVVQHILDQQGIHVSTTDAQRIGEHANVDLLLGDSNYDDAHSTLDRIGAKPGTYKIRPGSAEALTKAARDLGIK